MVKVIGSRYSDRNDRPGRSVDQFHQGSDLVALP